MPYQTEEQNEERRQQVEQTNQYIRALGFNLVHMRECEWRAKKVLEHRHEECMRLHSKFFPDTR